MSIEVEIQNQITSIERDFDVKILYACESGSRAWGFPSKDSDYDVRFIYAQRPEWYLSIHLEHKRDVIELPINDDLDINGWNLRKALMLYRKSNPPLLEWLGSPIIYHESGNVANKLRELARQYHSPIACMYHYFHMAQGNYRTYLQGDQVWIKKYFYVLRPLLAIRWLEERRGVVPTEFSKIVDTTLEHGTLKKAINELIVDKKAGKELDRGTRIPVISDFLDDEMERLEETDFGPVGEKCPIETLDNLFQETLSETWS